MDTHFLHVVGGRIHVPSNIKKIDMIDIYINSYTLWKKLPRWKDRSSNYPTRLTISSFHSARSSSRHALSSHWKFPTAATTLASGWRKGVTQLEICNCLDAPSSSIINDPPLTAILTKKSNWLIFNKLLWLSTILEWSHELSCLLKTENKAYGRVHRFLHEKEMPLFVNSSFWGSARGDQKHFTFNYSLVLIFSISTNNDSSKIKNIAHNEIA